MSIQADRKTMSVCDAVAGNGLDSEVQFARWAPMAPVRRPSA
ncbi:hypothetical protein AB0L05_22915 [Nonomuraea pusilla]